MISRAEIERLHAGLPRDVLLVIDAAYAEYIDDPAYEDGMALARIHPNVVTTRTFSKIYGLAGQRVGWAYGPRSVVDTLNAIRGPFNITSAAQVGALEALADHAWVRKCRPENPRHRAWVDGETSGRAHD